MVVETYGAIEVEATSGIICKFLKVKWRFAFIYHSQRKVSSGQILMRYKCTITIQLAWTANRKQRLACILFIWTKLALRTLVGGSVVIVTKRIVVLSAALGSTHSARCAPSLRVTLTPELISASLETILGLAAILSLI